MDRQRLSYCVRRQDQVTCNLLSRPTLAMMWSQNIAGAERRVGGRRQYAGPVHRQTPTHTHISCIARQRQERKRRKRNGVMNRLMKTGILINRRSFSSLNVNQQSRFVLSHRSENIPRQCCHCRSISTFESIYLKLISLPAVHYVEDSLAYIHDTTGIAMVQYSTVQYSTEAVCLQGYPGAAPSWCPLSSSAWSSPSRPTWPSRRWWPRDLSWRRKWRGKYCPPYRKWLTGQTETLCWFVCP